MVAFYYYCIGFMKIVLNLKAKTVDRFALYIKLEVEIIT